MSVLNDRIVDLVGWEYLKRLEYSNCSGCPTIEIDGTLWLFEPDTSEGDAGVILDHIATLGWAVTTFTSGWHGKRMIRCCIMRAPGGPAVDVVAETRPLAICRAFIQAMERWGGDE